jgi:hypothetical protein
MWTTILLSTVLACNDFIWYASSAPLVMLHTAHSSNQNSNSNRQSLHRLQAAQAAVEKTNSSLAQAEAGLTTANAAVIAAAAASAAANAGPTNLAESKSDGSTGTVVGVIVAVALLVAIVAAVFIKNKRSLPSPKYEAKASLVESEGGLDTAFAAAPFGGQLGTVIVVFVSDFGSARGGFWMHYTY